MESRIGLHRSEFIKPRTLEGFDGVELVTAEWIDWLNDQLNHTVIGDIPPANPQTNYYGESEPKKLPHAGSRFAA
ncbi:hypothetical protein ACH4U7_21690 [Streptomyces sp. NPDC020845]|uniref:hypothetical protein n=1 Tax=Streptomyces sp. NPDC020845 TaxID=3365096 RepID=UPI00379A0740